MICSMWKRRTLHTESRELNCGRSYCVRKTRLSPNHSRARSRAAGMVCSLMGAPANSLSLRKVHNWVRRLLDSAAGWDGAGWGAALITGVDGAVWDGAADGLAAGAGVAVVTATPSGATEALLPDEAVCALFLILIIKLARRVGNCLDRRWWPVVWMRPRRIVVRPPTLVLPPPTRAVRIAAAACRSRWLCDTPKGRTLPAPDKAPLVLPPPT